jgi:hypothetical protein
VLINAPPNNSFNPSANSIVFMRVTCTVSAARRARLIRALGNYMLSGKGIQVHAHFSCHVVTLIFLTPISAIADALKELRDSGLLPPNRLKFKIDANHANIKKWPRKKGEAIQKITGIIIPIRIENSDSGKAIDVLDISITSRDSQVKFFRPEMRVVKIGSEQKWIYIIANGGWSELFNDGKPKVIEAKKTKEYVIAVCEYEMARDKYPIRISFRDNWKRSYSEEIMVVEEDDNDTSSGKAS